MGVVNVTPDSFSDGGLHFSTEDAVAHALKLAEDGADLLDVGGESTRPGAAPVFEAEEIARVVPVIKAIRKARCTVPITIDTTKAAVAEAAVAAGADAVNDVSALTEDPRSLTAVAALGVPVVLMHMQGEPRTMQDAPTYDDVVGEVADYLAARVEAAVAAGIPRERIAVDPGIGFGKRVQHNLLLLRHLDRIVDLGLPVVVGTSRKSFIGHLLSGVPVDAREWGTAATVAWAVAKGAAVVRVHAVREMAQVTRMIEAIERP
jgi:dihydropteroate synthase